MGLRTEKKWGAKHLISVFLNKRWSQSSLTRLLRKIDNCGTTERKWAVAVRGRLGRRLTFRQLTTWYAPRWCSLQPQKPDMWPPNSPDLNPVDYAVWGAFQQRVYHGRKIDTVEELKRAIITEWQKLSQRFIDSSINEWHRRLECVVRNDGGHIEHCSLAWVTSFIKLIF